MVVDQFLGNSSPATIDQSLQVTAFPNPSHGITRIIASQGEPHGIRLEITNPQGQLVRTITDHSMTMQHQLDWDGRDDMGSPVAEGIYIIRVIAGKETGYEKLILVK